MRTFSFTRLKDEVKEICFKINKTLRLSPFAPDMTAQSGCYPEFYLEDVLGSSFKIRIEFHLWYAHYDHDDCDHRLCDEAMHDRMECALNRVNRNMRKWLTDLNDMFEIWSDNIDSNFFGAFVDTGIIGIQDCNHLDVVLRLK